MTLSIACLAAVVLASTLSLSSDRARCRQLGIAPGRLGTGPLNAITDVAGVKVGHITLDEGESIRTGATAVLPHSGNLFQEKTPAGLAVGNGFGKLMGSTQIRELGEIETPIVLTNTLGVPRAADAILDWTLAQPGNEGVRSVNPVVGETNDGFLNDIRRRALTPGHVLAAIESAKAGPVTEGAVGAGRGTVCFGWKGGIGTSSRKVGDWTLGSLVQSNYGGNLEILGIPIYREIRPDRFDPVDGSILIVVATDAPISDRNLERLASRALLAVARTGSYISNGSGDYAIAFSTAESVRRTAARRAGVAELRELSNDRMTPLFEAAVEATEEAILNSLFMAEDVRGHQGRMVRALPALEVRDLLVRRGRIGTFPALMPNSDSNVRQNRH